MYKFFLLLTITFFSTRLSAHAIWVESDTRASVGKAHAVRVYFGEFAHDKMPPMPTQKWFSDLKDFQIVCTAPDGKTDTLTKTARTNYYESIFTPTQSGVYKIDVLHTVRDLYKGMQIHYAASTAIWVGKSTSTPSWQLGAGIFHVQNTQTLPMLHKPCMPYKLYLADSVVRRYKVEVIAENGWQKTLHTDLNGTFSFTPLWKGKYIIKLTKKEDVQGDHNGQHYTSIFNNLLIYIRL